jgi:hypothetical protein
MQLFALGTGTERLRQRRLEIIYGEIDMHGRPMAIVPAHVSAVLGWRGSHGFGQQTNGRVT